MDIGIAFCFFAPEYWISDFQSSAEYLFMGAATIYARMTDPLW